jgi:HEAT repeat protein
MYVFVSYKHEDVDFAENVMSRLEARGFQTWTDHKIRAGEEWRTAIDLSIKNSFALIVIMTPEAKASEYVTYEWAFAWGMGIKVIPVMLRKTELHPRLEALQYLDFTVRTSRPWERLLEEVQAASKAPLAHTVRIPLNAPPFVRQAIITLDSASSTQRKEAIATLLQAKTMLNICGVLIEALAHPLSDVRVSAAQALGKIRDVAAVPALRQALYDPEVIVRVNAAEALGAFKDVAAVPALSKALHDPEAIVRDSAAWALGEIKDATAVPALSKALHDPEAIVRESAAEALGEIKDTTATPDLCKTLLHDSNAVVRSWAAEALGEIKDATAVSALSKALLHDSNDRVRKSAAAALGWIGDAAAIPALSEALHASDIYVRDNAAWALGQIQDVTAIPTLTGALRDSTQEVHINATEVLGESEDATANENNQTTTLLGDR